MPGRWYWIRHVYMNSSTAICCNYLFYQSHTCYNNISCIRTLKNQEEILRHKTNFKWACLAFLLLSFLNLIWYKIDASVFAQPFVSFLPATAWMMQKAQVLTWTCSGSAAQSSNLNISSLENILLLHVSTMWCYSVTSSSCDRHCSPSVITAHFMLHYQSSCHHTRRDSYRHYPLQSLATTWKKRQNGCKGQRMGEEGAGAIINGIECWLLVMIWLLALELTAAVICLRKISTRLVLSLACHGRRRGACGPITPCAFISFIWGGEILSLIV